MKKIKLAKTFLKVGKIISIVLIPVLAVAFLISLIVGIILAISEDTAGAITSMTFSIDCFVYSILSIVSLVLNLKATNLLENAKCKADIKKPAVLAIVAGALVSTFPIASGVLLFCTKDEDYK